MYRRIRGFITRPNEQTACYTFILDLEVGHIETKPTILYSIFYRVLTLQGF